MNLTIRPSQASGSVTAPPSKSMAHRQLIAAALGASPRRVENLEWSEDILATLDCLRALGASIAREGSSVTIGGLDPFAQGEPLTLPCRESASTLRFLLPLALLSGREVSFTGSERLLQRPLEPYERICAQQALYYDRQRDRVTVRGPLKPGDFELPGDLSSQFVTGLLFALPFLEAPSRVSLTPPVESRSYIQMTLAVLRDFGIRVVSVGEERFHIPAKQKYRPHPVKVEGDWSNAAFLEALNCLGGRIQIKGLNELSPQGDKAYREHFRTLRKKKPVIDISDCPDLGPVLMALAAAYGGAVLEGTERLKLKESDRGAAMAQELAKMGIQSFVDEHRIWVAEGSLHAPTEPLDSHNDHRIAMSLAVLLTLVGGELQGAEAVRKSWPGFFDVLRSLGILLEAREAPAPEQLKELEEDTHGMDF